MVFNFGRYSCTCQLSEKIDKLQSILNSWSARRLTLLDKITITKSDSLAVSQIVYLLSSLPSHQKKIHEINSILHDFLWDSKGDKIKRTEVINLPSPCTASFQALSVSYPRRTAGRRLDNLGVRMREQF